MIVTVFVNPISHHYRIAIFPNLYQKLFEATLKHHSFVEKKFCADDLN